MKGIKIYIYLREFERIHKVSQVFHSKLETVHLENKSNNYNSLRQISSTLKIPRDSNLYIIFTWIEEEKGGENERKLLLLRRGTTDSSRTSRRP